MARTPRHISRGYSSGSRAQAFDAAGASGLAFLNSQLELIDTNIVEPLQATTYKDHITVKTGGGYAQFTSAWATNYATTGTQTYGLVGTNTTDIPVAQADVQKAVWSTYLWQMAIVVSFIDLQRMEFALRNGQAPPVSLQQMYEESVDTTWHKALDFVTYAGYEGGAALINNPDVYEYVAANGASGSPHWASKTPQEILVDVNTAQTQTLSNSGYAAKDGLADTLLIPYKQFNLLSQPQAIAGVPVAMSTKEYIEKYCIAAHYGVEFKIEPLPDPWIVGTGVGNTNPPGQPGNGTDRAVYYKNDEKSLLLRIPQVKTKIGTTPVHGGISYESAFVGVIGSINFRRTTTMVYQDSI